MKKLVWLVIMLAFFGGLSAHAQLLASMQLETGDGGTLTIELTHTGQQLGSLDALQAYVAIKGQKQGKIEPQKAASALVQVYPLTPGATTPSLTAAALLASLAVLTKTATVDVAKAAVTQSANAQLVFTELTLPETPPTPADTQAIVGVALGVLNLSGGPPSADTSAVIGALMTTLNLPSLCATTTQ